MKLIFSLLLATWTFVCIADERPNIIWISAEDISPHLGCFGDPHAITPNLDALAKEGVRYTNVYTAAGVCAPCRSTIITGMYQNSIGTHHMRCNAKLPDWLRPFPLYLREAGYYCTNNSKTDYQFKEPKGGDIWDHSSGKAHWKNRREKGQPFFAVFNFTGCHESGIASESKYKTVTKDLTPDQRQDPDKFTNLPPYYPDTPIVREDWKRNYETITAMDAWAGNLIQELKDEGVYENTIIFFWSDHGVGLPRAKRWLYDSGTRIPFIVRIPEKFRIDDQGKPNTTSDELVNSPDFGPTVLNLAGVKVPKHIHGRAFLGDQLSEPRRYIYGARDRMDERYDIIRAVRDKRFRYIRNFEPLKPYYQYMNTPEKGATMKEIRRLEKSGEKLPQGMALFSAATKPVEELYDLENDPHEINNLAADPEHAEKLRELREALQAWQLKVGDIGLMPESEIEVREEEAGSTYNILRTADDPDKYIKELTGAATLASEGKEAVPEMMKLAEHEDSAIRYWAATGLGNTSEHLKTAKEVHAQLNTMLSDKSPAVRIAAGRALCRMGKTKKALPLLGAELSGDYQWARLQAAIALDYLDETARPVLPQLQGALKKQPNKYIIRVANRAVNDLLGTEKTVP